MSKTLNFAAMLTLAASTLLAHEEPFGFLRGAQSEPKGEWEITQWINGRIGKESGRYLGMDFATELEYGVTERLQVAAYLLSDYHFTQNAVGATEIFNNRNRIGVSGTSFELKYQFLDPFQEPFGFSVYFEPGYKTIGRVSGDRLDEFEIETKLILQKNFFEHHLITLVNYTIEPEFEREHGGDWETELKMSGNVGAAWRFAQHWWLGLEARVDTEFSDANLSKSAYVAVFAGPTLHYNGNNFFATLTVLPQVWGWPDQNGTGGLHLDDRERIEIQVKFGFEF